MAAPRTRQRLSNSATIGVVIPVYRVRDFIGATLTSVAEQTHRFDQVVLVDDRGDDDSIQIALEVADRLALDIDVVAHDRNRGLAAARNTGLAALRTDLVCFLDSDDLIEPSFADRLHAALIEHDADFAMCRVARITQDGTRHDVVEPSWGGRTSITGDQFSQDLLRSRVRGYACNKAFRRSALRENPFPVGIAYEDIAPALSQGLAARCVALIDQPLYLYRDNAESISRRFDRHTRDLFTLHRQLTRVLVDHGRLSGPTAARWRQLLAFFDIDGIALPAANMALRAQRSGSLSPELTAEAEQVIAHARRVIAPSGIWALLRDGAMRQVTAAIVLRLNTRLYGWILARR